MKVTLPLVALIAALSFCYVRPAAGQQLGKPIIFADRGKADTPGTTGTIEGPPAPAPPEVVARDEQGRVTVRAVRLDEPLRVDGRLDDSVYGKVLAIRAFVQQEPREGEPASEKTEIWDP